MLAEYRDFGKFSSDIYRALLGYPKIQLWLCVIADLDHLWGQLLKLLDANMPAEVQVWIDNLMGVVKPLIERANELFNMGQ